jgi:hypothetical protein
MSANLLSSFFELLAVQKSSKLIAYSLAHKCSNKLLHKEGYNLEAMAHHFVNTI